MKRDRQGNYKHNLPDIISINDVGEPLNNWTLSEFYKKSNSNYNAIRKIFFQQNPTATHDDYIFYILSNDIDVTN
jgi:hypothetical protein